MHWTYGVGVGYVCQLVADSTTPGAFRPLLLSHLVDGARLDRSELDGASLAVTDGVRSLTWAEYVERVARTAAALVDAGVAPGDRVAVRLAKSVASFVTVHAILRAGAVMVPIDPTAPTTLAAGVLADAGATALVTDAPDATVVGIVGGHSLRCVVLVGRDDTGGLSGLGRVVTDHDVSTTEPGAIVTVDPTAPAYIIYTSGSTGRPKGIVHSHASALSYTLAAAELYELTADDRLANVAALHFDQSTFELYSAPYAGSSVLVLPDPVLRFPASVTALLESHRVTVWYSVPSLLRQLSGRGALDERDLGSLRWVLFGGESYPPGQMAALMEQLPRATVLERVRPRRGQPVHVPPLHGGPEPRACRAHRCGVAGSDPAGGRSRGPGHTGRDRNPRCAARAHLDDDDRVLEPPRPHRRRGRGACRRAGWLTTLVRHRGPGGGPRRRRTGVPRPSRQSGEGSRPPGRARSDRRRPR